MNSSGNIILWKITPYCFMARNKMLDLMKNSCGEKALLHTETDVASAGRVCISSGASVGLMEVVLNHIYYIILVSIRKKTILL